MRLTVNGKPADVPDDYAGDPLLYVLRDHLGLNGPKYGCGVGACGACTVHIDGTAQRACLVTTADVAEADIVTLEGLMADGALHPVQAAWIAHSVPQCGYCQNGQIMTAVALLSANPRAGEAEIAAAMDGVVCRCGTHARIRRAIAAAQAQMDGA